MIGLIFLHVASAQEKVWLKMERGDAVVLNPLNASWQPVTVKTEVPRRTFLLTKEQSTVKLFAATDVYEIRENSYVFLEDVISKSRTQLVAELTRIEAEQLPNSEQRTDSLESMEVGLTYGKQKQLAPSGISVPYKAERMNAVAVFISSGRTDAAVLTVKRMLARYPSLYFERPVVEQLFGLYERLELDGFLFDESSRLMGMINNEDYARKLTEWNTSAKNRLARGKTK